MQAAACSVIYNDAFNSYLSALQLQIASQPQDPAQLTRRADPASWVSVKVFCSSTFKDQLEERRVLKTVVMPELEVWCRARGIEIVMVDLLWGIPMNSSAAFTIRTCLGELDVCRSMNNSPYFLYLGGQRFGWPPSRADINDDDLCDQYQWMDGASVTSMEVLHGALRTGNSNAVFCLRDAAYVSLKVPVNEHPDFQESDVVAAAKQAALLHAIENAGCGHVIKYNPATDAACAGTASSSRGSWDFFAAEVTKRMKLLLTRQYPREAAGAPGSLLAMRRQHTLFASTLAEHTVPRLHILSEMWRSIDLASHAERGAGRRVVIVGAESGRGKVRQRALHTATSYACALCVPRVVTPRFFPAVIRHGADQPTAAIQAELRGS
jgi:hypothetical protein